MASVRRIGWKGEGDSDLDPTRTSTRAHRCNVRWIPERDQVLVRAMGGQVMALAVGPGLKRTDDIHR